MKSARVWLVNVHVGPYSHAGYSAHDDRRARKLLLHSHEIHNLTGRLAERGLTVLSRERYDPRRVA